jgi:type VI protein secretion system component Hcp
MGFLTIANITGDSKAAGHNGDIELLNVAPPAMLPPQLGKTYTDVQLTKRLDSASPQIQQANVQTTHFPCLAMHLLRSGQFLYADYVFHDATFSSYQQLSNAAGGPQEVVTVAYATVEWQYQPSDDKGSPVGSLQQGNGSSATPAVGGGSSGGSGGHRGLIAAIVIVLLVLGGAAAWYVIRNRRGAARLSPAEYYPDPPGAQFRIGGVPPPVQPGGFPVQPPGPNPAGPDTTTEKE